MTRFEMYLNKHRRHLSDGTSDGDIIAYLIVSNDKANKYSPAITALPIAASESEDKNTADVCIRNVAGIRKAVIQCTKLTTMDKIKLQYCIGKLKDAEIQKRVEQGMRNHMNKLLA